MMLKVTSSDIFDFQSEMSDGVWHRIASSASLPRLSTLALGSLGSSGDAERVVIGCGGESDGRATAALFAVSQTHAGAHAAVVSLDADLPLLGHAVASAGSRLFLFGGQQGVDAAPDSDQLWLWDDAARRWTLVEPADGVKPPARSYHAMCGFADGSVFVFGGCCSPKRRLSDLWRFRDSRWMQLSADAPADDASLPCARGGAAIHAAAADQLFLFFGFCGRQLGDVWCFQAGRWHAVPDAAPAPRSVFASASLGADAFLLFGGEREASATGHAGAGTFHDDAWLFDAVARTWKRLQLEQAPSARGWCAMSHAGARRLVLAGGLNDQNERLNEAFVLELRQ